jgi:hypothetical protein
MTNAQCPMSNVSGMAWLRGRETERHPPSFRETKLSRDKGAGVGRVTPLRKKTAEGQVAGVVKPRPYG